MINLLNTFMSGFDDDPLLHIWSSTSALPVNTAGKK